MDEVYRRLSALEAKVDNLEDTIKVMLSQAGTTNMLIKWVVLPLVIIMGGLVGIKLVWPAGF
mgnify:CR=1 FL=1